MAKKLEMQEKPVLWKDRIRKFGLPLSFTRYEATEERLIMRRGFFKTVTDEVMIYRITDIRLVRTFGQKIFGVGTVTLISSDKTIPRLELKNIKRSDKVRRFLSGLIESQREARRIAGREYIGGSGSGGGGSSGSGAVHDIDVDMEM